MKLEYCFPDDLSRAKAENTPLVIPVGTMEYHGSHCCFGCDTLIVTGLLERMEAKRKLLIAPPVWYSPASFAVAAEDSGTVHVEEDAFEKYIYYILKSYLFAGFKNIYIVIHHQYENEELMPMTLCCKKAAKVLTMQYMEKTRGQGWWGSEQYKNYYEVLDGSENPFNYIQVLPAMSARAQQKTGYDHAGKYETSLLMTLYPDGIKEEQLSQSLHWYTDSAAGASAELGRLMIKESLKDLEERIK